jgi:prepilin-type N-terminal cleavage/methylation domain-containing protein
MMNRRAFTIIELMVAISIIGILIAITIPVVGAMGKGTRTSSAVNSISVGVQVARYHATRQINAFDIDGVNFVPYRGAGLVITHANEARVVEHHLAGRSSASGNPFMQLIGAGLCGYRDVSGVEYLRLPKNIVIVGVGRNSTGAAGLKLLPPPFMLRFDQYGRLLTGNSSSPDRMGWYDGNGDGFYNTTAAGNRPASYTPPTTFAWDTTNNRYELPFERMDTVMGVYVVENDGTLDLSGNADGLTDNATINRIKADGKLIMFSRYTGNPLRND